MTWVALKMLVGDRTKYFGIIFGVSFSTLLMAQQMSIFCGIMMLTTSQIRDVKGVDLWVMDRDMLSSDDYKPMPDTMLYRVRTVPGVRTAVPFYKGVALLRKTASRLDAQKWQPASADSHPTGPLSLAASFIRRIWGDEDEPTVLQQVMLLGVYSDATAFGSQGKKTSLSIDSPPHRRVGNGGGDTEVIPSSLGFPPPEKMLFGSVEALSKPDSVLVDKYSCELIWREEKDQLKQRADYERFVGRTIEINDRRAEVVGVCDVSANFLTLPILYTTYARATQFAPPQRKLMSFILVQADPGIPLRSLSERIAVRTNNATKALTSRAFFWKTIYYYVTRTGLPINFGMTVALGFLVGTAVAGLTFYQFTIENLKQFGALKAMGTSNWVILRLTLFQALVVAPIGYSLGIGLAALFGVLTEGNPTAAFYMPWQVLVITAVAVLVICVTSSMLSIRRVLVLEPAIVFRT